MIFKPEGRSKYESKRSQNWTIYSYSSTKMKLNLAFWLKNKNIHSEYRFYSILNHLNWMRQVRSFINCISDIEKLCFLCTIKSMILLRFWTKESVKKSYKIVLFCWIIPIIQTLQLRPYVDYIFKNLSWKVGKLTNLKKLKIKKETKISSQSYIQSIFWEMSFSQFEFNT